MKKLALLAGAAFAFSGESSVSHAQDVAGPQLEEIVVTAQRQSEDLQKAAISVTAASGEKLIAAGVNSVQQLSNLAPALQITPGTGAYTWFSVRGVTNTGANAFADPAVAVNLDGVYLSTPTSMQGMMFDLERVEVLKGPQGTLYGRNATAGAINILPRGPKFQPGMEATLELGNYRSMSAQAALNLPVSDRFALRIAGQGLRHDGYFSDGSGDEDLIAGRVTALVRPSDRLTLSVVADYTDQGGRGGGSTVIKNCGGAPCYIVGAWTGLADAPAQFAPLAPKSRRTFVDNIYRGVTVHADWVNPLGALTVIAAHRWANVNYYSTATSILINERQHPTQSSVEARLASPTGRPIRWLVGGYYLSTDMRARSISENPPGRSFSDQRILTGGAAWAGFGQVTWAATDTLRLVGGLRYTTEKKDSNSQRYNVANTVGPDPVIPETPTTAPVNTLNDARRWSNTTWKAGLEWDAAPRSLIYANVSTGFKAGGFYLGTAGSNSYNPEHLTSYVLGSKNRFLGNRLQLNAEAFYLDYRDQQISYTKSVGALAISVTENAGRLTSKGVELEANWLAAAHTEIGAKALYLDAKYDSLVYSTPSPPAAVTRCRLTSGQPGGTQVNCNGLTALQSPRWTLNGSIDQSFPLSNGARVIAHVNAVYETRRYNHISYIPDTISPANTRWDASLGYEAEGKTWSLTAFVRNASNTVTPTYILPPPGYNNNGALNAILKPPRTYGVRLQGQF